MGSARSRWRIDLFSGGKAAEYTLNPTRASRLKVYISPGTSTFYYSYKHNFLGNIVTRIRIQERHFYIVTETYGSSSVDARSLITFRPINDSDILFPLIYRTDSIYRAHTLSCRWNFIVSVISKNRIDFVIMLMVRSWDDFQVV